MQNGQSVEITAKSKFLRETLHGEKDPAKVFEIVLREYRVSGQEAKQELVMALVCELAAYNAIIPYMRGR